MTSSPPESVLILLLHPSCVLFVMFLIITCERAHLSIAQVVGVIEIARGISSSVKHVDVLSLCGIIVQKLQN